MKNFKIQIDSIIYLINRAIHQRTEYSRRRNSIGKNAMLTKNYK